MPSLQVFNRENLHIKEKRINMNKRKQEKKIRNKQDKLWREQIKERDKVCVICGSKNKLNCHHKKSWRKFPQLAYVKENIVVLCARCHMSIHARDKFYTNNHAPKSYERIKLEIKAKGL